MGEPDLLHFLFEGGIKFCFPTFTFGYRRAVSSFAKGNSWSRAIGGKMQLHCVLPVNLQAAVLGIQLFVLTGVLI